MKSNKLINIISIIVPVLVAVLLGIRTKFDLGVWTHSLPFYNAIINSLTAVFLVLGYLSIKNKNRSLHKLFMTISFVLGGFFLVFYVIYHSSNPSTSFGGDGTIRYFYYFILISHILLSLIVLPLVLRAAYFGYTQQFEKHKKIAKFAFPIWLYVSITGVIAYLMISPYYIQNL